jgi:predicted glycoside hydrolase/deacetylase ChbG (UPF0249 family)
MNVHSSNSQILIVNADDFGLSEGVNAGIIEAHEHGIVSSASLMVRRPGVAQAAEYARRSKSLCVGIHIDLGEWSYRNDEWVPLYEVVSAHSLAAVAEEVRWQIGEFCELLGKPPTHVDSHQHVHTEQAVQAIFEEVAVELSVPLRHFTANINYCGDFYGQNAEGLPMAELIGVEALCSILRKLGAGITELACHPGYAEELDTMYRTERTLEVATLCHPDVRETLAVEGIALGHFLDVASL